MNTYSYVRVDKDLHGLLHVLLELGMKPVERAVDGYCGILHIDVIEKNGETYTRVHISHKIKLSRELQQKRCTFLSRTGSCELSGASRD